MTTPTLDSFFSGGGGKSVSWKDKPIGTVVSGTIKAVNPPQQQTDPVTKLPVFKKDGVTPKMSVRIDLQTAERDPSDPDDDGVRSLYVQGWMQGAIGDALRKAGREGAPEVGATLKVALSERTPNDNPALAPTNKFVAQYTPPAAAATGDFFGGGAQQPPPPVPQPSIAGTGYVQPPAAAQMAQMGQNPAAVAQQVTLTPEQVAAYLAGQQPAAAPLPARPEALSELAWNAMDDATKRKVAETMANVPPF